MLKRLFLFSALAFAGCFFFGCKAKKTDKAPVVTLVMAEVNPEETIAGQMDLAFKRKVEELSGGEIIIDLHCKGILGDTNQVYSIMQEPNSTIQMLRMSAVNLATYGCKKTALLSIPYTFASKSHFWRFTKSETAQELLHEPADLGLGLVGLFYGEEGFRHFFSTRKIESVSDFEGLKIRTTDDEAMLGLVAGLKAEPVSIKFSDLYSAFQIGMVDAAEQPIANYLANHFNVVAPYMLLDGHTLGVMETVITLEAWNALTEEQQQILLEAGKYASEFCRQISQEQENKVRAELEQEGATIIDVDDVIPWQNACAEIIKKSSAADPILFQDILNQTTPVLAKPPRKALAK